MPYCKITENTTCQGRGDLLVSVAVVSPVGIIWRNTHMAGFKSATGLLTHFMWH